MQIYEPIEIDEDPDNPDWPEGWFELIIPEIEFYYGQTGSSVAVLERTKRRVGNKQVLKAFDVLKETEIISHAKNVKHNGEFRDFMVIKDRKTGAKIGIWAKYRGFGNHIQEGEYTIR